GLRALYMIAKTLSARGAQSVPHAKQAGQFKSPHFKLLNPSPTVYSALEVMGLTMSLEIHKDLDKALVSFSSHLGSDQDRGSSDISVPPTLTDELKQTLRASGTEAEKIRRDILSGKRFLFVMGSYYGKRHLYEHAQEVGVNMVILDGPGHWTQGAVQEGLFERFIEVDLGPTETLAERAFAAIKDSGLHFDAIATFEDGAGPLTALLATALGLPGHPLLSIGFSKNKIFTREVCVEAGIPSPRFFRIKSESDLETAATHVGFPAVLKPISGFSSIATYLVKDESILRQRYIQTVTEAKGHLKTMGVHSDDELELIWAKGFDMTLEEFLDGEEFDVDILLSEGEPVYANVIRDLPQPHLKEVGSQMPPAFPADKQVELIAFAEQVLRALEFTDGAFHVEVKYTSNGPRLVEVNARIGGGPIYYFHRHVWGVDLVEQYLLNCLGVPIRPQKAPQPLTCLLTSDLPSPYSGTVTHADFLQPIANHPKVILCKSKVEAGQKVIGSDTGVPDWLGEIMVYGDTVEEASQTMDELLAQVKFPIVAD
ncbi:MAG TPA: ATP-grasp domain-containing protein, partial [Anaerolineales bacterium]